MRRAEKEEREKEKRVRCSRICRVMRKSGDVARGKRGKKRERAECRKLEGRRSRPGLVLGLADSLALSQRNASNAGEPLLFLSPFVFASLFLSSSV